MKLDAEACTALAASWIIEQSERRSTDRASVS
jgi:hypothetical protein